MDEQGLELEELRDSMWDEYISILRTIERKAMVDSVIIHHEHFIPKLISKFLPYPITAIAIGSRIFCREEVVSREVLRHEMIHIDQQRELGMFGFLARYLGYYLLGLWRLRNHYEAYMMIPFEQEAYKYQGDNEFLWERRPESWKKYEIPKRNIL